MDFFSIPDRFNLKKQKKRIYYTPITPETGEMAEWPKAAVSKTVNGFTRSGVRIPLSPPFFLQKNGERRRKSSLHAFVPTKALHSKPKVFFTSSPNSREDLLVKTFHSANAPLHL